MKNTLLTLRFWICTGMLAFCCHPLVDAVPVIKPPRLDVPNRTIGVGSRGCDLNSDNHLSIVAPNSTKTLYTSYSKPHFLVKNQGWKKYRVTISTSDVPNPIYDKWFYRQGDNIVSVDVKLDTNREYRLTVSSPCSDYPSDIVFAQIFFQVKPLTAELNYQDRESKAKALASLGYELDAIAMLFSTQP